jgi:hypothetical protein
LHEPEKSAPSEVERLRYRILCSNGDPVENVDALIAAVRAERALSSRTEGAIRDGYELRLRDGHVVEVPR